MSSVTSFDPPITGIEIRPNPDDPEGYLLNIPACIRLAKETDTPAAKRLYRLYRAEYHALNGQPLSHETREQTAFMTAAKRCGWRFAPGSFGQ